MLLHAGLVRNLREGRSIRYFADTEGLRGLLGYLLRDCCGGRPEICDPLIEDIACHARPTPLDKIGQYPTPEDHT